MIRPLRRAHRYVVFALLLVLPTVIAIALMMRPEPPWQTAWPFDVQP